MIKKIILSLLFFPLFTCAQNLSSSDSLKIINVLEKQKIAWNNNDIDEFMNGYFNSEKLVFSGQSGPVYGWKSTKERYLTKYNSKELMGNLKFDINKIFLFKSGVVILLGKFYLKREIGDSSGFFTLVFKKVKGKWYIISDHTS
ncbi:MAG: YybH family protein [Flavobacteriaceae bacterium]